MHPHFAASQRAPAPLAAPRAARFTAVIAARRTRVGKTLLARVLCDYLLLSGRDPDIFDTDAAERKLAGFFPRRSAVIDLDRVTDQMRLFDSLAAARKDAHVVDLAQKASSKFFELMRETDYLAEAAAREAKTVVFYVPDGSKASYEEARELRESFSQCPLVVVKNELLGQASAAARRGADYRSMTGLLQAVTMPHLDPACADMIEEPGWSFSAFMRRPLSLAESAPAQEAASLLAARAAIRAWTLAMFQEIHRVTRMLHVRA